MNLLLRCLTIMTLAPLAHPLPAVEATFKRGVNISHFLSQLGPRSYGDRSRFNESDLEWIARQGFDHIRLPVDGQLLLLPDGRINGARFEPIDAVLRAAGKQSINVVLDLHTLPGSNFKTSPDTRLFYDESLIAQAVKLWTYIAERYQRVGPELRFELLNEPVAPEDAVVTAFYQRILKAVRAVSPERTVIVCSNRWGSIETIEALEPLVGDPHLVVAIHYYEPHVFTHQGAGWVGLDHPDFPPIPFPGAVPDLRPYVPKDHYAYKIGGKIIDEASIEADFERLAKWAKEHAIDIYVGEFGVYKAAESSSRQRWVQAVLAQCRKHGMGWAVWDYEGGFAVRDAKDGRATEIIHAFREFMPTP